MNNIPAYDYILKIVLTGDYGAGRTSLSMRYVDGRFNNNYMSTIGVDFRVKTIQMNNQTVKLQVWDTMGAQRFRAISRSYFYRSNAILIVFDITSNKYDSLKINIQQVLQNIQQGSVVVIVGSKADLKIGKQQQENIQQIKNIAEKYKLLYYETSSKENIGVQQLFTEISRKCVQNIKNNVFKSNYSPNQSVKVNKDNNNPKVYSTCW